MARGWGSKAVEAQQADREAATEKLAPPSPAEVARLARRRTLMLARARAAADLEAARNAAHRRMLEAALQALDAQIRDPGE